MLAPTARLAPALLCLVILVACGDGGGSGGTSDADYFPYTEGNRWGYQTLYSVNGAPQGAYLEFLKVSGSAVVDGEKAAVMEEFNPCGIGLFAGRYVFRDDGLYYADGSGNGDLFGVGTYKIATLPIQIGNSFTRYELIGLDYGSDVDGDGQNETLSVHSAVTVVGLEGITVPAGSFADCVLLQTSTTQSLTLSTTGAQVHVAVMQKEWFARGIGAVKRVYQTTDQGIVETREFTLESYFVDGNHREESAPEVLSSQPTGSIGASQSLPISVRFSEDMDPTTVSTSSFQLVDAAGTPIPGRVTYADRAVTFFPSTPLGSASYTAIVTTNAEDLSGNPLTAPYSWNFTLDVTSPEILETFPTDQATGVSSNTTLTVKFSEDVLPPVPVFVPYFTLRDAQGNLVSGNVTFSQREVTFTPASALSWGKTYTATISQTLRDVYGNHLAADYSWSFTVEPGLFAPYSTIQTGSWAEAVAIGDVNSDGRDDIALITSYGFDPVNDNTLFVFHQTVDGTLLPAAKYATGGTYMNRPTAVAIGDVNNDGRDDIVVGIAGIGIEVFLQNASGTLAPKTDYANVSSSRLKIADMDGDGLLDVVGGGAGVSILYQNPDNTLSSPEVTALTPSGFVNDLKISDVNNDGLPDAIIVNQQSGSDIGILLQSPSGGLSSPTYHPRPSVFSLGGVAVGDMNADSVADIVVSTYANRPLASIGVFTQNTSGQFEMTASHGSYDCPRQLDFGDLNSDGLADIVVQHQGWNAVGVYLQGAGGGLLPEQLYAMPSFSKNNPQSLAIGDINGDGIPDIAIAGAGLDLLYNTGAPMAPSGLGTTSPQGTIGIMSVRNLMNARKP